MTAIKTNPADSFTRNAERGHERPTVVVATDGSDGSAAAFAAVQLMTKISDLEVRVVSVLEPVVLPVRVPHELLDALEIDAQRARDLGARVIGQLKAAGANANDWPTESRIGRPAELIGQIAQEHDASLIITGPGKHGLLERIVGGETAARVVQLARIPLLAASPDMRRLPQRVVIAMDLDPLHLSELSRVLRLFGPAASVTCVHVQAREDFPGSRSAAFARAYETAVAQSFKATENAISKVPGLRADLVRLNGDPAAELLRYAEYAKTELLVLGLRRHHGLRRLLGGGVALKVLRGASCSVLIVPERVAPATRNENGKRGEQISTLVSDDPTAWASLLKQVTERNAGRHATLEADGAAIGAMVHVVDLPFIGADYDHRDGRVEILLGDFVGSDRHFSRNISNPVSIAVLKAPNGKDSVVCVTYKGGQTLVTFT